MQGSVLQNEGGAQGWITKLLCLIHDRQYCCPLPVSFENANFGRFNLFPTLAEQGCHSLWRQKKEGEEHVLQEKMDILMAIKFSSGK